EGACSCGRGFPLLGPIEGRTQECLITPANKVINPAVLAHYLFVHNGQGDAVRHYQVIQEGTRCVTLRIVPGDGWNDGAAARLHDNMLRLLGPEMEARVHAVADIPPEQSGK